MKYMKTMLLLLVPALLISTVHATQPAPASGDFLLVGRGIPEMRFADGNTILNLSVTYALTGGFNGTFVDTEKEIIRPTGEGTFQGRGTFTGTVNGISGTLVFSMAGTFNASIATARGQFVILSGTGGLSNLRGRGTLEESGPKGTYSAQIHFDPD